MTHHENRELVARELDAIPRGSQLQNMYRMVYEQARLNGLGNHPNFPPTEEAAHVLALRSVQELDSTFQPQILGIPSTH